MIFIGWCGSVSCSSGPRASRSLRIMSETEARGPEDNDLARDLVGGDLAGGRHARVAPRAPGVEVGWRRVEAARRARADLGEFLHAEAVFQGHAVGIEEIQEHAGRGGMA